MPMQIVTQAQPVHAPDLSKHLCSARCDWLRQTKCYADGWQARLAKEEARLGHQQHAD
jgi:hypothetical protein